MLGPDQLPAAQEEIAPASAVHIPFSLSEGELIGERRDPAVLNVVVSSSLFQEAAVESNAARSAVVVDVVEGFRARVERAQSEAGGEPLLHPYRHPVISIVAVIAEVAYGAELRVGPEILVFATDLVEGGEV